MIKLKNNYNKGFRKWKLARAYLFITAIITFMVLLGCSSPVESKNKDLESQKQQWIKEMKEAFPDKTQDTAELQKRLAFYQRLGNKMGELSMLRVLGIQKRNSSEFRSAINNHTSALHIAYEIKDTINITNLLNELGTDFRRIGALEESLKYHYLSLQMGENYQGKDISTISSSMASAYNGIGIVYRATGESDEAIKTYNNALEILKWSDNYRGIAINNANIGSIYFDKGKYDKAEEYYRISLENNEKINLPLGIALCKINIGEVYEKKNKSDEALEMYLQAYELLHNSSDKWHWLNACFHLGEMYMKKGNYSKANEYLDSGLHTALAIQSPSHIRQAYLLQSDYNYAQGKYKLSVDNLRLSQAYADTLQQEMKTDRLLESRVKYETEKFTRQLEQLDKINRDQVFKRKISLLLFIPVIAILLGLLLMLFYKRKLEQRQAFELKNLERMRSNFFRNMTHEFRTPITVINGLSYHLRSAIKDDESSEAKDLEAISRQGCQLIHLVNQILDFSRSEAGENKPKWRHGDMVKYLNVISECYIQYAQSKGVNLFVYAEVDTLPMNFVPSYVKIVIDNLLSNSLKHSEAGSKIILHLKYNSKTKQCHIQVKDDGEGISAKDLQHIFELYYISNSTKSKSLGSGIGLALSKQLLVEIGGSISVSSIPGKGTEFTIILPVSNAPIPENDKELFEEDTSDSIVLAENKEDFSTKIKIGKNTILIIEDNKDVAHYISTILSKKYSLLHASNGNEGLLMSEQHVPDIIITDIMMPERDGFSFTRELRASLATSHIPVIMITAKGTTEDKLEGLKAGADAYLTKPFDERELLVRINKLLDSRTMLKETYSKILLQENRVNNKKEDLNMTFISKLSINVNKHLCDKEYFPAGLAKDMCLSESQLNRKIKAMTGHTITSFVMRARLNKAKEMLSKSDNNITEVAFDCGFSDLSYFSRSFKKILGYSPSQFIKIRELQDMQK